jgi:dTMP kinase
MKPAKLQRGVFIVLSGPDGSGKSTQTRLLGEWLTHLKYDVLVTKEPGGDAVCQDIRKILVHDANERRYDPPIADGMVEFFLFCADRRQHVKSTIEPALAEHKIVVCDRYVPDTYAYQCHARRALDRYEFKYIMDRAVGNVPVPDLTFWCNLDPKEGIKRKFLNHELDRFEAEDISFHLAVAEGFAEFFKQWPEYAHVRIDAAQSKKKMARNIKEHVTRLLDRIEHSNPAA